jgi:hypothetical protein
MDIMDDLGHPLKEPTMLPITRQTLLGLSYLHVSQLVDAHISFSLSLTVNRFSLLKKFIVTSRPPTCCSRRPATRSWPILA